MCQLRVGKFRQARLGTFAQAGALNQYWIHKEYMMLGKLAGAWLGSRAAGRSSGAKGAILGYGAAALARRSVPALAAVALGGWAFKKLRERRGGTPSYPSDSAPSSPSA